MNFITQLLFAGARWDPRRCVRSVLHDRRTVRSLAAGNSQQKTPANRRGSGSFGQGEKREKRL